LIIKSLTEGVVNGRDQARIGGVAMLALLGLFGILAAGVAADAILSTSTDAENDDSPPDPQANDTAGDPAAAGDLLDQYDGFQQTDDLPDPEPQPLVITGSDQDDLLSGGQAGDAIEGGDGADLIDGRRGADDIDAGAGNDGVWAGDGDDTVAGGAGKDTIEGQGGHDLLAGGDGDDALSGHEGADSLAGDAGNDTLFGGGDADRLDGGSGDDWLAGGTGADSLAGGEGSDILDGNQGDDWLSGLAGDIDDFDEDFLNGGEGNDTLVLGAGDHASGGEGEDDFVLHDWLTEGGVAHISDYDADRDQLIIMYDPVAHPDPALTLELSPNGQSTILLDGAPVATIMGSPVDLAVVRLTAA
jgi:Ca2+-binding RTX toxin-like protein